MFLTKQEAFGTVFLAFLNVIKGGRMMAGVLRIKFTLFALILLVLIGHADCFAAEKTKLEPAPVLRVRPNSLSFVCGPAERGKEIAATNLYSQPVDIKASATADWIKVEPSGQSQVSLGGTGMFTVFVDCKAIKPKPAGVGYVVLESMGFINKVKIQVK